MILDVSDIDNIWNWSRNKKKDSVYSVLSLAYNYEILLEESRLTTSDLREFLPQRSCDSVF
jgi:hypothetical protein